MDAPAAVDVIDTTAMKTNDRAILALVLMLSSAALAARAQAPGSEKVLFPVVATHGVSGAFGSRWVSTPSVLNTSNTPVTLDGGSYCFDCPLGIKATLEPGLTYDFVPLDGTSGVPGSFLFVDSRVAHDLHFGLRVRDVSHAAQSQGTEIPVVHQDQFRSDRIELLGVPLPGNQRYTLRVYSLDPVGGDFRVRVYGLRELVFPHITYPPDSPLGQDQFSMIHVDPKMAWAENYPGYAEITVLPMSVVPPNDVRTLRLEIEPTAPGLRIWAFVTLTNNDTQSVTVISPHSF